MFSSLDFDPIQALAEPRAQHDPFLVYGPLLDQHPVFWYEPLRSWVLTRYDDCSAVLRDSARFSTDWSRVGEVVPPAARSIQALDPPEQTPVRRLFVEAVRAAHGDVLRDEVVREASARLDALASRESFDFVTEFAEPLALHTTAFLLGVPAPEQAWFVPLANAISDGMDGHLFTDRLAPATAARAELAALTARWLADPGATGVVGFVAQRAGHYGVEAALTATTLRVALHAGYTSASKLLSLSAVALLGVSGASNLPGGLDAFRSADPNTAVEELTRYTSLVQGVARACVQDTELAGVTLRQGDAVTLLLGAANRDPARFDGPAELRLTRSPNPHLGFGRGTHACIGSLFAVMQTGIVFSILADRYPRARSVSPPTYPGNVTQRTVGRFEVALS
ncbi:cytochrome P450 [Micromonospora sp. NPDC047074]|uniref:cytochrome P450 n=1 Tax=Micromonospora sp. NPDC047074 TaxID=3154339 RepID=UPI0033EC842C